MSKVKVIIENGIVTNVLRDRNLDAIDIEILNIDEDYEDYNELVAYRDILLNDSNLNICDFTTAGFIEEE